MSLELGPAPEPGDETTAGEDESGTDSAARTPDGESEPVAARPMWREAAGLSHADTDRASRPAPDDEPEPGSAADTRNRGRPAQRIVYGSVIDTRDADAPSTDDSADGSDPDVRSIDHPRHLADTGKAGWRLIGVSASERNPDTGKAARPPAGDPAGGRETDTAKAARPAASDSAEAAEPAGQAARPPAGDSGGGRETGTGTASHPRPSFTPATPAAPQPEPSTASKPRHGYTPAAPGADTNGAGKSTASDMAGAPLLARDRPLLADAPELRASWQRVQAGFVDDPRGAVRDAADLVEHATLALVAALRQRQRQLRELWDGPGSADGARWKHAAAADADEQAAGGTDGADGADGTDADSTERFRLLVQRYRALFNQICQP